MASQETPPLGWGDASQGQGQEGDLLVHERWPKSSGFVGLQAQAREQYNQQLPDHVRSGQRKLPG